MRRLKLKISNAQLVKPERLSSTALATWAGAWTAFSLGETEGRQRGWGSWRVDSNPLHQLGSAWSAASLDLNNKYEQFEPWKRSCIYGIIEIWLLLFIIISEIVMKPLRFVITASRGWYSQVIWEQFDLSLQSMHLVYLSWALADSLASSILCKAALF